MANHAKSEVAQLFSEHGVVLVHCSGEVKGSGNEETNRHNPLERIFYASDHRPDVCCSTIRPGDSLYRRNFYGPLGLIIDPIELSNISVCWPGDAGTTLDSEGKRFSTRGFGCNTLADVSRAITDRGTPQLGETIADPYNEICCADFKIVGLFALGFEVDFGAPGFPDHLHVRIKDVGAVLPNLPLFLWDTTQGIFLRLNFDSATGDYDRTTAAIVPVAALYDEPRRF